MKKILKIGGILLILIVIIAIGFLWNTDNGTMPQEVEKKDLNYLEEIPEKEDEKEIVMEKGGSELQGRLYAIDTGETVKIVMGKKKDELVIWCEEIVALDPEFLNYEIL